MEKKTLKQRLHILEVKVKVCVGVQTSTTHVLHLKQHFLLARLVPVLPEIIDSTFRCGLGDQEGLAD